MGELIAILSGKGGTGKTSVCAGIATALAADGQKVLCVDCDVGLRNLDISLGMSDSGALSFLDVCRGDYELSQAAEHPEFPGLFFLTAPVHCQADAIDPEQFGQFVRQARQNYDFVLLDAPAGVDAGFKLAASCAERCVIVTGPGPAAIRDACRVADLLELMGKTNSRLVVNRVSHRLVAALNTNVDDVMDEAGLPLLGVVPEDQNVTLAAAFGRPLLLQSGRGAAAGACRRIAKRLQGLPVPITIR